MPVKQENTIKYVRISIAASVITISLKGSAYLLTGSVGLLSDALESFINLAAAVLALKMLMIAMSPPDREHPFGHSKAEYFSSVTEGILILLAAIAIGVTATERLIRPRPVEQLGAGLIISASASLVNLGVGLLLVRAGRENRSILLEADGKHLLTDVWTTAGVLVALLVVKVTGWVILDPVIAIVVAVNIVYTGIKLIKRSVSGLMDSALPESEQNIIRIILDSFCSEEMKYHSLYTRRAASRSFIFFHLLMPGDWHINRGHSITKEIEQKIKDVLADSEVFIHIEPINDPDAFDDYLE